MRHFTVHVDDGQLAFVRADATLIRDGEVRSYNIDYFTLLRDANGAWKFVNGSYTTKPPDHQAARTTTPLRTPTCRSARRRSPVRRP